jgi:dUTP pyrophosphatase
MNRPRLGIKRLNDTVKIPKYQTSQAAGFDLAAMNDVTLEPGETKLVGTGLIFDIPNDYEVQIRPRSGISLNTTLRIANAPGTIDSDFKNEIMLIVTNISMNGSVAVSAGARLAQAVITPVLQAIIFDIDTGIENEDTTTVRVGGFGSTGKEV